MHCSVRIGFGVADELLTTAEFTSEPRHFIAGAPMTGVPPYILASNVMERGAAMKPVSCTLLCR